VRTLKAAMKNDTERTLALDAAITLRIAGLFKVVAPYLDSGVEEKVIALYLCTSDSEGIKQLAKRFTSLDETSESFEKTFAGLCGTRVAASVLEPFRDCIKDGQRADKALEILRFQFDNPELSAEQALANWETLVSEQERNFRTWALTGLDLFKLDGWARSAISTIGCNVKLGPNSHIYHEKFAIDAGKGTVTINMRTLVLDGSGGVVALAFADWNSTYRPTIKDREWITEDVTGDVFTRVPLKRNEWQEHVWKTVPQSDGTYKVTLHVDGKELIGNGRATAPPSGLLIEGKGSTYLVGGLEFIQEK
jgi:hypothetical protein